MARPQESDYAIFFNKYVQLPIGNSVQELIEKYSSALNEFINSLPELKADYAYAADKWTVKDVVQHLIDAERVFAYRVLCFSRKDQTNLPGFNENNFAANANAKSRSLASLKEEFAATRRSTDLLLLSFTEAQLQQKGTSNHHSITANAIAFIIFGHILHHKQILEERYL
jgi:uncharacterized damage-inducible protein DinB